jgi:methylenetetrahydrofolate dehydrogenase (NADP+)/methenyltetrahydrofolate cyclohydrolase
MTAIIIDGSAVSARVRAAVAADAASLASRIGRQPGLATILVGDDPASATYVRAKRRACDEAGIRSLHVDLPAASSEDAIVDAVNAAANDDAVDGILVQLPLPAGIDANRIIASIPPEKDVDGFHPHNVGALALGWPNLPSCTPAGVIRLLDEYDIPIAGANATVVGSSNIVGMPMALMLMRRDATVTVAQRLTRDLASATRNADILVVATGVPGLIEKHMVKPGAAVLDVGITRTSNGLVGDVDFEGVANVAGHLTPVPGGVGPMTIAILLENTVRAARLRVAAR